MLTMTPRSDRITSAVTLPPERTMRQAFAAKDPSFDGLFFVAVKTTGVFCRPTCRAKTPRPENIEFFPDASAAARAGYRACKLCRPETDRREPPAVVAKLLALLDSHPRLSESDLVSHGIDPSTARRQFKAFTGTTFSRYQRQHRLGTALAQLQSGTPVIAAQQQAGFESPSGFREAAEKLFGTPPAAAQHLTLLTSAWIPTPLGPMLAIAHAKGLALLDFADRKGLESALLRLRDRFATAGHPAVITPGQHPLLEKTKQQLTEYFAGKRLSFTLPLLPAGTDFELKCWTYLQSIPPGETRSYGQQATALGSPGASRAAGRANGMNYLSILIPCHRVIGANGKLTGYGGGLHRKEWLLSHERAHAK